MSTSKFRVNGNKVLGIKYVDLLTKNGSYFYSKFGNKNKQTLRIVVGNASLKLDGRQINSLKRVLNEV